MKATQNRKRKRGKNPMVDGDIRSATAVTHKNITETKEDGTTVTRRILVSLDRPCDPLPALTPRSEVPFIEHEVEDITSAPTDKTNPNCSRVRI
jgi:hypothetical protein